MPPTPPTAADPSLFQRRPKTVLTIVVLVGLAMAWSTTEMILSAVAPYAIASTGYVDSENGRRFGWGFDAHETVRTEDPDTGNIFLRPVNNHGWRDVDRTYDNPTGAFRIAVIGDSSSFGYVVPLEKVFTRVLEQRLRGEGINVQVLNMSGPGFGTDQELEILKSEAMRYGPDLVIFHVTGNDLANNLEHRDKGKPGARKPFFYELDAQGRPERKVNPRFSPNPRGWRRWKNNVIRKSEILKRTWALVHAIQARFATPYRINDNRVRQAAYLLGPGRGKAFLDFMNAHMDQFVTEAEISAALNKAGTPEFKDKALVIMADRYFEEHWEERTYEGWDENPESEEWRLFLALLKEAQRTAKKDGAGFAVISDHETALFEWHIPWLILKPTEERRRRFLDFTLIVHNFAAENGMGIIETPRPLTRARNDPHNNADGFQALADSIYDYLMENHRAALKAHMMQLPEGAREGTAK